jgi:hypothetical protein
MVAFPKIKNGRLSRQKSKWPIFPTKFKFHCRMSHKWYYVAQMVKICFWPPYTTVAFPKIKNGQLSRQNSTMVDFPTNIQISFYNFSLLFKYRTIG